jgi:hypothetical protein
MKKTLLLSLFVLLSFNVVFAQIDSITKIRKIPPEVYAIIREYFDECGATRLFFGGKGIVEVVYYKDSLLRDNYRLTAMIDDEYLDHPPNKYFHMFMDQLFLFYDADKSGKTIYPKLTSSAIEELKKCVGDRVYIRPPKIERWVETIGVDGKIKLRRAIRISGGNPWNTTLYTFLPEGGYEKMKSL